MRQVMPSIRQRWCVAICVALAVSAVPRIASAQTKDKHWGVAASFSPSWTSIDSFKNSLYVEGGDDLKGKEFSIGITRGSTLGGEWSVSYVRKPINDMTLTDSDQQCVSTDNCFSFSSTQTFRNVYLRGVEYLAAIPFATFKQRVQVGIVVGGGIAVPEGDVTETFTSTSTFRPAPNQPVFTQTDSDTSVTPADEVFFKLQPLGKVEGMADVILAPGLKIRFSGGLNVPGTGFRISGVYLFGDH